MWSDSLVFAHVLPTCSARQHLLYTGWEHWPPTGAAPSLSPDPWASGRPHSPLPCSKRASSPPALSLPLSWVLGLGDQVPPCPFWRLRVAWAWVWAQLRCPSPHQEVSFQSGPWELGFLVGPAHHTPIAVCPHRHPGSPSAGTAQPCCVGGQRVGLTMVLIPIQSQEAGIQDALSTHSCCLLGLPCPEGPGPAANDRQQPLPG